MADNLGSSPSKSDVRISKASSYLNSDIEDEKDQMNQMTNEIFDNFAD